MAWELELSLPEPCSWSFTELLADSKPLFTEIADRLDKIVPEDPTAERRAEYIAKTAQTFTDHFVGYLRESTPKPN